MGSVPLVYGSDGRGRVRVISTEKAIGMGAVAGGLSQGLATFGLAAIVISQGVAVVMLSRTFERGHALRGLFAAVSICASVLLNVVVWLLVRVVR